MKLRTKIPALLVPLIVLSFLLLGWFTYVELRQASEQRVFAEMRTSLEHLHGHMETEVETARGNIELLANQTMVRKYILTGDEDERYTLLQPALLRLFTTYQKAFPEYYEIRVFLPDGYEDARHTYPYIENLEEEEGDSAFFRALQSAGGSIQTSIFRNPDNQKISLFVGKALTLIDRAVDPVGVAPSLRGYLGLTIDMSKIEAHVREGVISKSGYLFATDAAGNVLFESSRRPLGAAVPLDLTEAVLSNDPDARPRAEDFRGERAFISGVTLHEGFNLFTVLPEGELRAISYEVGFVVAAITLLTILVTTLCIMLAMEYKVIRPIHNLGRIAKEIGRGNWDIEISGINPDDEIGQLAVAFEDMAENLQQSDDRVRFLAYHDSLTGLPNRVMFREYLERSVAHAGRVRESLAVLFLDVDNFKNINDTMGHHAGDLLLQEVAVRIGNDLRGYDYVASGASQDNPDQILARLGGDEFIILLPDITEPVAAGIVAQRLIDILAEPITITEQKCYVSVSIGITIYPDDGENAGELTKNADIAMYHAKDKGKNTYQYFEDSMNVAAVERVKLEGRLRHAVEHGHLELFYQPQVDAVSHEVVGLEALLRWRDPDDGLIAPNEFIPLAETSGLILPIGEWVLIEACRQARAWQKAGYPVGVMSVNVSSVQFAKQDIAAIVKAALDRSQLDPGCLEIEITESAIMSDPKTAVEALDKIKALGVSVALDDFGTGYSSLSYLRRFPIDTLKIDRSFVHEIEEKPEDAEIVEAIVAMAHTLKLRVVVEGIETEEQLDIVVERHCDVIQGFLFSRPLPANEVVQLLSLPSVKFA